jgi:hypothetical protein
MMSRWLQLALALVVVTPGALLAQQDPSNRPIQHPPQFQQGGAPPSGKAIDAEKMYEDIEILRRILDRKLAPLYPTHISPTGGGMIGMGGMQGGMMGMSGMQGGMMGSGMMGSGMMGSGTITITPLHSLEGVYLKGQGVVYTATLSSLELPAKAKSTAPGIAYQGYLQGAAMLSEWDSVRRQVRNEKDEPKKPEAGKPASLSDVLLNVLAENGHHFAQLGENESLTLVLTVRDANPSLAARKSPGGSAGPDKPKSAPAAPSGDSESSNRARNMELLGDLHLKQGRYEEALKHYKEVGKQAHKAEFYRKVAQCYLGLEKYEDARGALDRAIALSKENSDGKNKPADAKPKSALPVKLIISAQKRLLDVAKDGKLSFEEFRRRSSVETLRFGERR